MTRPPPQGLHRIAELEAYWSQPDKAAWLTALRAEIDQHKARNNAWAKKKYHAKKAKQAA